MKFRVSVLTRHALYLERIDAGAQDEMFVLLAPETPPEAGRWNGSLPQFFHHRGGFWLRDPNTGQDQPLKPGEPGRPQSGSFSTAPHPEVTAHVSGVWWDRMQAEQNA
jgi:hypothetical protein